jgi:hypothetical protein
MELSPKQLKRMFAVCVGCVYRLVNVPTSMNSIEKNTWFYANQLRNFCKRHFLSLIQNISHITFVSVLFLKSRPTAIFFAVMPVIVDSVYGCVSFSKHFYMGQIRSIHVVYKFFKRIPQYLYSFSSIYFIFRAFGVFASLVYAIPPATKRSFT